MSDLQLENTRLREALDEIATNAESMVKLELPHITRETFARSIAHRARFALRNPTTPPQSETEAPE